MEDFSKNFFVSSVVGELFTVESQLCSTRTADLFKAFDRERGRPVAVWMLRAQFDTDSPKIIEFTNRLGKLSLQGSQVARILTAGVDPTGVVFSVISPVDGYPLTGGNLDAVEAERRFLAACKVVEQLHLSGISCGDICSSSFWVGRNGDVHFVGIMGSFEEEASETAVPPLDTLAFVAPEQTTGQTVSPSHDVFALGVLGYQLFTKNMPFENHATRGSQKPQLPRVRNPSAPLWIDEVLLKCLEGIPSRRYTSAGALLAAIYEAKDKISKEQSSVKPRDSGAVIEKSKTDGSVITFQKPGSSEDIPDGQIEAGVSSKRLTIIGGLLAIVVAFFVVGGFLVYRSFAPTAVKQPDQQLVVHREAAVESMRKAIDVVNDTDSELNEKRAKFQELQQSDDPLAHDILVRSAVDGENPKVRIIAEQAIIARAKRLHYELPASTVNNWLATISVESPPPEYEFVLKSLNASIPVEGRREALRKIFQLNPELAELLLGSLVVNSDASTDYNDVASEMFGAALKVDIPKGISAVALLITSDAVYREFREPILDKLASISPNDLLWALDTLVQKGGGQMSTVANALIERNILDPVKLVFLDPLRDNDSLPDGIPMVLMRGLRGELSKGDIESLGMWLDQSSELALLAVCADDVSVDLQTEAVEYLAGRGIGNQPQGAFVEWIKRNAWESRGKLAEPLGVAALSSRVNEAKIRHALQKIEGFSKDGSLFSILFQAPDPRFIELVLEMYQKVVPPQSLVTLLAHPSKKVRLAAIVSLKDVNQVGALNAIIQLYNAEIDPDVRKAYSDNLWVIKQRLGGHE